MPKVKELVPKITDPRSFLANEFGAEALKIFKFKVNLSFVPILRYWEKVANSDVSAMASMAQVVLDEIAKVPEFSNPVVDFNTALAHPKTVELLLSAIYPMGIMEDEMSAAYLPYSPISIYASEGFRKSVTPDPSKKIERMKFDIREMATKQAFHAYSYILEKFYNYSFKPTQPPLISIPDHETYLERFFQTNFSNRYTDIVAHGDLPELDKATLDKLKNNQTDLAFWESYLPMELFEFRGVTIAKYHDISKEELTSQVKVKLMEKNVLTDKVKFQELQYLIQSLVGVPGAKLGVSIFEKNKGTLSQAGYKVQHSFIQRFANESMCEMSMGKTAQKLREKHQPVVVEDLSSLEEHHPFRDRLMEEGVNSLIFAPLMDGEKFLGLFELGSPEVCSLSYGIYMELSTLLPVFSMAIQREYEEEGNRIERIVKEECTAIHPSVEWRFNQAAVEVIRKQNRGEKAQMEPIVFDDVYPLYAASDIRGSSVKRNLAIQADLAETLNGVVKVLEKAYEIKPMPILKNAMFRIGRTMRGVKKGLGSGDELQIIDFMETNIKPLFDHLLKAHPELEPIIEKQRSQIDPKLGLVYKKRKDFEESLTELNESVSSYLDKKEAEAQEIFPHYFEKYKTDGVEYNIYVGQSIMEDNGYHPVYLKNLRLWQLETTCEVAQLTHELKDTLKVPLATTHLILVHSSPMAIRFRTEEKQFDVDGAYNIRYEIVKKRIDKANIRDTNERLTQPGMIAIVYSTSREAAEYREYIEYLQHAGCLEKEIEDVPLQDLQGIKGLRALRVKVKMK